MTATQETVTVWQQPDGLWRWSWSSAGGDGTAQPRLISHRTFDDPREAAASAARAYPTARVETTAATTGRSAHKRMMALTAVAVGLLILSVLARRRRSGHSCRANQR